MSPILPRIALGSFSCAVETLYVVARERCSRSMLRHFRQAERWFRLASPGAECVRDAFSAAPLGVSRRGRRRQGWGSEQTPASGSRQVCRCEACGSSCGTWTGRADRALAVWRQTRSWREQAGNEVRWDT
eukprot:4522664-Pleurochrysis_carterae.AAC.2